MDHEQFEEFFRDQVMRSIFRLEGNTPDIPMRRQAWNDTIDGMQKDGILGEEANDWCLPDDLKD